MDVLRLSNTEPEETRTTGPPLNCPACRTSSSMRAAEVPKFDRMVRAIGYLFTFPALLGLGTSIVMVAAIPAMLGNAQRGAAPPTHPNESLVGNLVVAIGLASVVAVVSLCSGLLGFLLLQKRKVYLCDECRFILERA